MKALRVEATIEESGTLTLRRLPLERGQSVEVIILLPEQPVEVGTATSLAGSVVRYERPLDPVADADWDAAS
jgi:hypothetical protein